SADPGGLSSSTPLALPLPQPPLGVGGVARPSPNPSAALPAPPAGQGVDPQLVPGRTIEPIDLLCVLRLAGARDLDIAIARQRIEQSLADLMRTRSLWLPSLFLGPT